MTPYLSIVVTSRNDNHGGDLLRRTSAFMSNVFHQAKKWSLPVELIMVDWNPATDRPLLQEVLPKPCEDVPVVVKYVVVPPEEHRKYRNSDAIPLYQMIAKNVGIRRASAEFILCTNIDILFSDACFAFLSERKLRPGGYYRANRCDIPKEVMDIEDRDEQLRYASERVITRFGRSPGHEALIHAPEFLFIFPSVARIANKLALRFRKWALKVDFPYFVIDFDTCGDFTLMSRKDWEDIEGYAELDMYSIHIDSMALWAALGMGKEQRLFPYEACIYHIYHEDGWSSNDAIRTIKFLQNKPCLDYTIVFQGGMQLVREGKHWGLNEKNWGFADKDLEMTTIKPETCEVSV